MRILFGKDLERFRKASLKSMFGRGRGPVRLLGIKRNVNRDKKIDREVRP